MGAHTQFVFNSYQSYLTGKTIKVLLLRDTGVALVDNPDDSFVSTALARAENVEVTVTNYSRQTLTGVSLVKDDSQNRFELKASAPEFTDLASGQTIIGQIAYVEITDDSDSPIIGMVSLVSTPSSLTNFRILLNGVAVSGDVFRNTT